MSAHYLTTKVPHRAKVLRECAAQWRGSFGEVVVEVIFGHRTGYTITAFVTPARVMSVDACRQHQADMAKAIKFMERLEQEAQQLYPQFVRHVGSHTLALQRGGVLSCTCDAFPQSIATPKTCTHVEAWISNFSLRAKHKQ